MKIRCLNCMKEYEEAEACPHCGFRPGTPPKEICHLYPGVLLADRYLLGTVVSYGGFGILYRAWDQKLDIMVAVKEYFPANYVNRNPGEKEIFIYTSKNQELFQQELNGFLDEAKNTAKFSSYPNIVNVYDYFKENGTAYMVMEFMEGETLKQYTKKNGGKLGWEEAVKIISSICDDLAIVHSQGIIHRDISPDNIMLLKNGSIKLFDFGAARFSHEEKEVTRTVILKIGYAPPEQYRNKSRQGSYTDVYALGATLYRTITGKLPDESVNRAESLRVDKKDTLDPPKTFVPELPDYLNAAIMRAMAIQPELRFRDTSQLKQAIKNEKSFADLENELKFRKKRRLIGMGVVIAAAVVGILGCFGYYQSKKTESTLRGSNITIWAKVSDTADVQTVEDRMKLLTNEFKEDYPDVALTVRCIAEAEYQEELTRTVGTDEFPTLFEGEDDAFIEQNASAVSELMEMITADDYICFSEEQTKAEDIRKIPLGMSAAVSYRNVQKDSDSASGVQTVDSGYKASFLNGGLAEWIGDTENYEEVQTDLPGIYEVDELNSEKAMIKYEDVWCVSRYASERDRSAAERFLYYCLGETTQDLYHLQNAGSIPVNKAEFEVYLDINQEFSFLKEKIETGNSEVFWSEASYQEALDEKNHELYNGEKKGETQ